jgi:succinyl-CoA synthetase beta subunit
MAKLFEYQGKEILKRAGVPVPKGYVADSPEAAERAAREIGGAVVIKAQAWVTGRAGAGGIKFAATPEEARSAAASIIGLKIKGFAVRQVLVEERLEIAGEYFAGVIIDDVNRKPMMIVSSRGGSGIEEIARQHPESIAKFHLNPLAPPAAYEIRNHLRRIGFRGAEQMQFAELLSKLWQAVRASEARSAEINPVVRTASGAWLAADCHFTIDDYAAFRHPELGIEIAREFDRPATDLEKIAYKVEQDDYRGTFYFIQLQTEFKRGEGVIGFHGSGGGGSMMSMDALLKQGFKLANFCDTSGNPPASKVYRAARIILTQGPVDGYFLSGSGVASQEQFHSARGLVKAFREVWLDVPAVIRLGGNGEDEAVEIIARGTADLPAPVEGYRKSDTPDFCAGRMKELLNTPLKQSRKPAARAFTGDYEFKTPTGRIRFDYGECRRGAAEVIVNSCKPGILKLENGVPVLAVTREEAARNKCIECLACEIESLFAGYDAVRIDLPIPGLDPAPAADTK